MLRRFAIVLMFFICPVAFAQFAFPPTLVQENDISEWDEQVTFFRSFLTERVVIGRSGFTHILYSFPDYTELGRFDLADSDELTYITRHFFDQDDGVEILISHLDSQEQYTYYVIDLTSGSLLYSFEGDSEIIEDMILCETRPSLSEFVTSRELAFVFAPDTGDKRVERWGLNQETGNFEMLNEFFFDPLLVLDSIDQFRFDDDSGYEVLLRQPGLDHYYNAMGLLALNMEDHEILWDLRDQALPFHFQEFYPLGEDFLPIKVYIETRTTHEDFTETFTVYGRDIQQTTAGTHKAEVSRERIQKMIEMQKMQEEELEWKRIDGLRPSVNNDGRN